MAFHSRNRPTFGSTDWAVQQFMRMLDREDRIKGAGSGKNAGPDDPSDTLMQVARSPEEHDQIDFEDLYAFTPGRRDAGTL